MNKLSCVWRTISYFNIPLLPHTRLHGADRDSFTFSLFIQGRSMFARKQCQAVRWSLNSKLLWYDYRYYPGIFGDGFRKITKNYQDRRFACLNKGISACDGGMSDRERLVWMGLGKHDSERTCSMQDGNSMDSATTTNATKDSATYKHTTMCTGFIWLTLRRLMSYIYIYIWSTHSWCF